MNSRVIGDSLFVENVKNGNWEAITAVLANGVQDLKFSSNREKLSPQTVTCIAEVVHSIVTDYKDDIEIAIDTLCESYRFLRNACCNQKNIQDVVSVSTAFDDTAIILENLLQKYDDNEKCSKIETCIQVGIQFLGNAIVENTENQRIVWDKFFLLLMKVTSSCPVKIGSCACMVIYNILLGNSDLLSSIQAADVISLLYCQAKGSEFAMFIIELVLAQEGKLEIMYENFSADNCLLLLDAIWIVVTSNEDSEHVPVPVAGIKFLASQVKLRADSVLNVVAEGSGSEPAEMLRLLEVVAAASSRPAYQPVLQQDASLLISCACLLKAASDAGKQDNNVFTSVQRLTDIKPELSEVQKHPAFGFKVSLVRLVANLCYRHKYNQEQVREMGCLPAVLDACNLDVHNPLLLQWGILAVRNLLEDNNENKQIVAGLVSKGPASNAVLRELGIVLEESEDGKLCIAPMRRE